jgi:hypothetical protein
MKRWRLAIGAGVPFLAFLISILLFTVDYGARSTTGPVCRMKS